MKRVLLFLATNLAILVVLSVVVQLFGIDQWLARQGMNLGGLLVFSAILGFGGAFVSLAMSKWIAKRSMGVRVITEPRTASEQWLVETVRRQSQAAGIGMPEVGIFPAPVANAFATGARRDSALVAVSAGLLQNMNQREVEAVLAHEVSHVANGDMVTLTLIQGVLNTFVFFIARVVGGVVDSMLFPRDGERQGPGPAYFICVIVADIVFGILASIIVFWFSRQREFRADRGGARLAGVESMISALERLKVASRPLPGNLSAFGIAGDAPLGSIRKLFMSHPPLEERIAALRTSVTALA
jgi:heat shock protein HtpX